MRTYTLLSLHPFPNWLKAFLLFKALFEGASKLLTMLTGI